MRLRRKKLRVLLVDDQPFIRMAFTHALSAHGFEVLTAADGAEGLQKAKALRPDLIVLDLEMPGLDGIEVCVRLKAHEATRPIPVVILTATQDPQLNDKAFTAGAEATVRKTGPDPLLRMLQLILTTERAEPSPP